MPYKIRILDFNNRAKSTARLLIPTSPSRLLQLTSDCQKEDDDNTDRHELSIFPAAV